MLTEHFIAATIPSQKPATSANLKDAGIFMHELQPMAALRSTFKKSATPKNGLAVTASHIFAAQAEKAVIHVYNREKGNQEAVIPLPERVHSVALAASDTVVVLGMHGGSVILWETCTGREVQTYQAHLEAVTTLAVDPTSNFLLSGSGDSSIHVWSLLTLLSFWLPPSNDLTQSNNRSPLRTLSSHRAAITALAVGHSASAVNIAVSASQDNKCIVWNYRTGEALRTYLLPAAPLCLALDPADRAFYTAYEDGAIQFVDFFAGNATFTNPLHDPALADAPVQPPLKSQWSAASQNLGACLSLSVSYDGTMLLSGHESGKVVQWDIGRGIFTSVLADLNGAVTNIHCLPPLGFPELPDPRVKVHAVRKPRLDANSGPGVVPGDYTFAAQFSSHLALPSFSATENVVEDGLSDFEAALTHPAFPSSLLEEGLAQLASWNQPSQQRTSQLDSDFMALDGTTDELEDPAVIMEKENAELRAKVEHMQRLQLASFKQLTALGEEKREWLKMEEAQRIERLRRKRKAREVEEGRWAALGVNGGGVSHGQVEESNGGGSDGVSGGVDGDEEQDAEDGEDGEDEEDEEDEESEANDGEEAKENEEDDALKNEGSR